MTLSPLALTTVVTARRALGLLALPTPGTPTLTVQGTPGSTTYTYQIVAVDTTMITAAGAAATVTTGPAMLNSSTFVRIAWAPVRNATGYQVYRRIGGVTQGLIAVLLDPAVLTLDDTGLTADGLPVPATADESQLESAIDGVSALCEQFCGRVLASRTFTDALMDGHGRSNLYVRGDAKPAYPVTSLTALTIRSTDLQRSLAIDPDPALKQLVVEAATGRLTLYVGVLSLLLFSFGAGGLVFPVGRNNVMATFVAGYDLATHPAERRLLEQVVLLGIRWWFATVVRDPSLTRVDVRGDGGMSLVYGGGATTRTGMLLPEAMQVRLQPFVCRRLA